MSDTSTRDPGAEDDQDVQDAASLTTAPVEPSASTVTLPRLGAVGMLRWAWRQLTSMRIALILLFMLSLAAIPGSLIPQRNEATDPAKVVDFLNSHKVIGPVLDRLQFFEVYKSAWFSAIYLLLFVSLIGCIVPRTWAHAKVLRKPPPPAPRNLARMPAHVGWRDETANPNAVAARLDAAEKALKAKRFRVVRGEDGKGGGWVSAEKGYLRELGNLLFHIALVGILAGFAVKGFYGYKGKVQVIEGESFTNLPVYLDDKDFGGGVDSSKIPPFNIKLDSFYAQYDDKPTDTDYGQPRGFQANVTYTPAGSTASRQKTITLNHPLTIDGTNVYLVSHGYAPVITVKNKAGTVVFQGPVKFFESGAMLRSSGTVKVLDGMTGSDGFHTQLGLQGFFLPTYAGMSPTLGPVSAYPALVNPTLILSAYTGRDLGKTASVYTMDTTNATKLILDPADKIAGKALAVGESVQLPDGIGSVTFDGVKQYAQFDINHDPSKQLVLPSAVAIVLGLVLSLGIRRRRVFVRVRPVDGDVVVAGNADAGLKTVAVEVGGLARAEDARLADEVRGVAAGLRPKRKPVPMKSAETSTKSQTSGAGQ